jgi:tetratricopeptide (TPR) repeat protein
MLSNIIPLDGTVAERWVYVPIIGVLGFAGLVIAKLINYQKFVWLMVVVALIFIPLAMIRTYVRIGNWYSNYTLGAHDVLYENSAPMDNDYASALIKLGNVKESLKYLKKAVALEPNYLQIRANLGLVLAADGQISASKKLFYDMLQNKNNINSYDNIALFFYQVEKDPDIIISFLKKPLALSPQNITLNQLMATAYFEKGATASALFYANRAYKLDPSQANLQLLKEIKK